MSQPAIMPLRQTIKSTLQRITGHNDVRSYVRTRRLLLEKKFYRQSISIGDFKQMLDHLGLEAGRVVWMQSSWNQFYNVTARPTDIIETILERLGPDGTLVMPAFPLAPNPARVLNIDSAPSSTGLLTEIFRRTNGARRSIHLTSSVAAIGPAAEYLVKDHHRVPFTWGDDTPYQRLIELDARLSTFGLGHHVGWLTPLHFVECHLYEELPFYRSVFDGMIHYRWRTKSGDEGEHTFHRRVGEVSAYAYRGVFSDDVCARTKVSNLTGLAIDAKVLLRTAIDLGRRGITNYTSPKSKPELFQQFKP